MLSDREAISRPGKLQRTANMIPDPDYRLNLGYRHFLSMRRRTTCSSWAHQHETIVAPHASDLPVWAVSKYNFNSVPSGVSEQLYQFSTDSYSGDQK
jgi:hypothetical protein